LIPLSTVMAAPPLILFYSRAFPDFGDPTKVDCGGACEFTSDLRHLSQAKAVVFYIPTSRGVPLPRKHPRQRRMAWSLKSTVNYLELTDPVFMQPFEIKMTYRRDATVWWPYFGPDFVRLDAVGGTELLVRADVHRDGLIFPCFPHGAASPAVRRPSPLAVYGELEIDGFGITARDMGYQSWGMPNIEVLRGPV
jgi:hypothetical protein